MESDEGRSLLSPKHGHDDDGPDPSDLTWGEKAVVLALMTSVSFSTNITISLVLPFLPQEINSLGLPGQLLTGFVFAVFPFMILVLSPLCNVLARKLGRVPLLYAGVPLQASCVVVFGMATELTKSPTGVVVLFLVSRALQGFGAAMANLAIFAIVAESFPESLGKVMGFNEVIIGVGFMTGPVLGSLLYSYGGFALPFLAASGVLTLSFPFVVAFHRQHEAKHELERERERQVEEARGSGLPRNFGSDQAFYSAEEGLTPSSSQRELGMVAGDGGACKPGGGEEGFWAQVLEVVSWRLVLSALVLLIGTGAFGWVETILSLHLQDDLGFQDKYIGMVFAVINVTYSLCGPFVGALADKFGYKPIMIAGLALTGVSFVMVGPVSDTVGRAFGRRDQVVYEVALLALFGAFQSLAMIPTLPAMKECVPGTHSQHKINTVVMIFNQFQNCGLMFSPPVTGALAPAIGWADTMALYGGLCIALAAASASFFGAYGGKAPQEGKLPRTASYDATAPLLVPSRGDPAQNSQNSISGSFSRSHSLQSPVVMGFSPMEERFRKRREQGGDAG
eukprot:CAMPEP_0197508454 /NCGR_PEP_ID=MMETSP1312-20131121/29703_1 /TAXON_ID=464262 /ORGANISM="Genus nov. species nov., Strain RCC2335" /LENGTH=564 /DNA_ID=CAMNT_0043056209 /DNA_START=68 /DNA_END=1762 /DNA_ORIENTATION=-